MKHFKLGIILIALTLCFSNTSYAQTGSTECLPPCDTLLKFKQKQL